MMSPSVADLILVMALMSCLAKDTIGNELCPPLSSDTLTMDCSFKRAVVNCSEPMPLGSRAEFDCLPAFTRDFEPGYRLARCEAGGVWDKPLFSCRPDCGLRLTRGGTPLIAGGEPAGDWEFPWHAGLYQIRETEPENQTPLLICGGAIITDKLVITAAHCVWDGANDHPRNASLFKVVGGKYSLTWDDDDPWIQRRNVDEIKVHELYRDRLGNFFNDIAILRMSTPFVMTWNVNLACVDWRNERESQQLRPGNMGVVPGWGYTEAGELSDNLRYLELPFVASNVCIDAAPHLLLPLILTEDKFCAGFQNQNKSLCVGDTGGIYFKNTATNRYDIRGIVSINLRPADDQSTFCYTKSYTSFTKLSRYYNWIQNYMKANP